MKANFFLRPIVRGILASFIGIGCTSSPRGAPIEQRASNAAADVLGAAIIVVNPSAARIRVPAGSGAAGELTRIEVRLGGLMACASISARQANLEIRLGSDEGSPSAAFGTFSEEPKLVLNGRIVSGQNYFILLSSRSGRVLAQQFRVYTGETPWRIEIVVPCPDPS